MLTQHECEQARLARDPRFDGLFFILVKTTKIFCRNICKVRMPLEKNVEYAASAQQALAKGYRPCLRCRPDSAPNSSAWQGVNTTLNRAIKLLTQRLDDSIESIADSLGISTRYLNKLFQEHMQISAKRYRIYQQVLLAKRLLQETNLPVEKVAESVGFASARQLQQHVKTYLRLTPMQLRTTPIIKNDKAAKKVLEKYTVEQALLKDISMLLAYRPPYNWPQVRDFFAKRQINGNEAIFEDGFVKILSINTEDNNSELEQAYTKIIAVKVEVLHIPEKNGFIIKFNAAYSAYTLAIISTIKRMLDVDASPQLIEKALLQAGLTQQELVSGLRIPGVASEFEAGCRAILGQQVSVAAAVNKVNHLHAYFASEGDGTENIETHFPTPHMVANSDLLFLKIPAARRQTLIDLAQFYQGLLVGGPFVAEKIDISPSIQEKMSSDEQALLRIKGIGPWTFSYIALRAKGDTDIWLNTDLVIKQQVAKLEQSARHLNNDLAAPWRSYLTLNLWSMSS